MLRLLLKNLRDSEALCQIQILPKSLDSLRWREWNDGFYGVVTLRKIFINAVKHKSPIPCFIKKWAPNF